MLAWLSNLSLRRKILILVLAFAAVFYVRAYRAKADLQYTYKTENLPARFEDFAREQIRLSKASGVPEYRAEKLTVHNDNYDGYAILYIHGFGATRAEGEAVGDAIADALNANIYYARLPGHGSTAEAHAAATFDQYLQKMETALLEMPRLGKKIIVMGTSTGALVATYLASAHSDKIFAVVLASPFWDFADKTARLLNFPGGLALGELFLGKDRDARWKSDPEKRQHPDYYKYWLAQQKFAAVVHLNDLRRFVVQKDTFARVTAPVLNLIYYKDKDHHDDTIDIGTVRKMFPLMKNSKNRLVEIADGNHVMLSAYVRTDKVKIQTEILRWLKAL